MPNETAASITAFSSADANKDLLPAGETRASLEAAARKCEEAANQLRAVLGILHAADSGGPATGLLGEAEAIDAMLRVRRLRDRCFGPGLFADPAWDILLELYVAWRRQQRVSISSLCIGAGVPMTTTVRWVERLSEKGLTKRIPNPMDSRVSWVELTEAGLDCMGQFVKGLAGTPLPTVR